MCWMLDDPGAVDNELNCGVFASGGAKVRNVMVMLIQVKIPESGTQLGIKGPGPLRDSNLHPCV